VTLSPGEQRPEVEILVNGRRLQARQGESVAIALLNGGVVPFRRTPVSSQPRAPLCLMGVCFECLVAVDGAPNVQSCMVEVREGMRIELTGAGQ
jgi:predicted molibdopterin-dependent oxidoreductase YjgC